MTKIDIGFVVLTYRNAKDLEEMIPSVSKAYSAYHYRIVVVNSFYDETSKNEIEAIALANSCDFINVENRGYGYGNNRGIEYLLTHYEPDYLVVANPDTLIKRNAFDYVKFKNDAVVVAPCIRNLNGKYQNPYWVIDNSPAEFCIYYGHKHHRKSILYLGIAVNKILREVFHIKRYYSYQRIFAAHGSFMIMTKKVIDKISLPYDENMFLFAEENLLAHVLKQNGVPVIYTDDIEILHKEDGSMSISRIDENAELSKSIIYYYEKIKRGMHA